MIVASVDKGNVMLKLGNLERAVEKGLKTEMYESGLELLRLSQMEVPHRTGTLQNSGTVQVVGADVIVGYHTPYATRVHEAVWMRFRRGRKAKYLEDPLRRNQEALGAKFAGGMKKVIKDA